MYRHNVFYSLTARVSAASRRCYSILQTTTTPKAGVLSRPPQRATAEAPRTVSSFAVVHHGDAYARSMQGLHGQQLALAQREGEGKDDPDFDPFIEEEMEEARLLAEQEMALAKADQRDLGNDNTNNNDDKQQDEEESLDDTEDSTSTAISGEGRYFSQFDFQKYTADGFLRRNASERAILAAGAPAGGQVAVIPLAGTQFKVTVDDIVIVNRLAPPNYAPLGIGSIHTIRDTVLLVSNTSTTLVGMPYVPGAQVDFMIEEITRDAKLHIFKRRKKGLRSRTGFRRDVSVLRILDIRMPAPYDTIPHLVRPEPAPLVDHRRKWVTPKPPVVSVS